MAAFPSNHISSFLGGVDEVGLAVAGVHTTTGSIILGLVPAVAYLAVALYFHVSVVLHATVLRAAIDTALDEA